MFYLEFSSRFYSYVTMFLLDFQSHNSFGLPPISLEVSVPCPPRVEIHPWFFLST